VGDSGQADRQLAVVLFHVAEHDAVELAPPQAPLPLGLRPPGAALLFRAGAFRFALPAFAADLAPLPLPCMGARPPVPAPGRRNRRRGAFISGGDVSSVNPLKRGQSRLIAGNPGAICH